jgi:hypothetical protein
MQQETWMSEVERQLREARDQQTLAKANTADIQLYGAFPPFTVDTEWQWIKLTSRGTANGEFFYAWDQMIREPLTATTYQWKYGGLSGSLDAYPAIELNNSNLPVNDSTRYLARWNPDTSQWIFFLKRRKSFTYPPNTCHGGLTYVYYGGGPTVYFPSYNNGFGSCGVAAQMGVLATPDDPGILVSFREYVDYGDNQYLVVSYDNVCQGTIPSWRITPGFTTGFGGTVPILDVDHPVTIRWELKLTSNAKKVMSDDNIAWFDSSNKRISYPSFIGGSATVSADKPLSGSKTFQYGTSGFPSYVCSVSGGIGDNGAISLSWENGTTASTGGSVKRTYKITLVDFAVTSIAGSGGGPDTTEAVAQYTGMLNIAKGKSRTFGNDGDICQQSDANDKNIASDYFDYVNTRFAISGFMYGTQYIGAMASGFVSGRWAKGTGKVKMSSCDATATIYDSLPATLSTGVAVDDATGLPEKVTVRGFSFGPILSPIDPSQPCGDFNAYLSGSLHTLGVPAGPLESIYTEEWWDEPTNRPFRWANPLVGSGAYSYCRVALKWKFEGPI